MSHNNSDSTGISDKKNKMHYSQLNEIPIDSEDCFNFYGVIIDAGYPYKHKGRFLCTLKVID